MRSDQNYVVFESVCLWETTGVFFHTEVKYVPQVLNGNHL